MKNKLLIILGHLIFFTNILFAQNVSIRVTQINHILIDPDGAGPATGSIVIKFELTGSAGGILADGIPFSMLYQSSKLMASPSNSVVKAGLLASAPSTWNQTVFNSAGNTVSVSYGGQNFDKRTIISFSEPTGNPNVAVSTTFTSYAEVTYWTLSSIYPQGGYVTPETGVTVPQNSLSSDGGLSQYPYLSPELNNPVALGSSILPVTFSNFTATCTDNGALLNWTTSSEINADYFEIQQSKDGNNWNTINKVKARGNSTTETKYEQYDLLSGASYYRIKQVDINGSFTFSTINKTNCNNQNNNIVLYPIPAKNILNVLISSVKAIKTQLEIYDAIGKLVKKVNTVITPGTNNFPINIIGLLPGQYYIKSADNDLKLNKKFTIIF